MQEGAVQQKSIDLARQLRQIHGYSASIFQHITDQSSGMARLMRQLHSTKRDVCTHKVSGQILCFKGVVINTADAGRAQRGDLDKAEHWSLVATAG
jgi:hypothetical protein